MSGFDGLRVASSALHAQRRALEVVGQNVANVNTPGYSRQRAELEAVSGPLAAALLSRWDGAGGGVLVDSLTRLRDGVLELRGHQEHALDAGLARSREVLGRIEAAFGEPSDDGLSAMLSDFRAGWEDLANHPDDLAARTQLVERATTLCDGLARVDAELRALADHSVAEAEVLVADVDATAVRIADLNEAIRAAVHAGLSPNELMDQRDLMVGQLAERIGVTARPAEGGMVDVFLGGTALVQGALARRLALSSDPQPVRVVWEHDDRFPVPVGGEVGALLGAVNDVVPRARAGLAGVAQELLDEVNPAHLTGFGLDGSTGRPFFALGPTGLEVAPDIVADVRRVAAAGGPGAPRDGSLARQIAGLSGADASYRELVAGIGVEGQAVNRRAALQASVVAQVDAAREATAGVNLDEEMVDMVAYQHAYAAAARFLTAVDETLDTLINGTGLVGR